MPVTPEQYERTPNTAYEVIFERALELIDQEAAPVDGFAAGLDQASQGARGFIVRLEWAQTIAVVLQDGEQCMVWVFGLVSHRLQVV